MNNFRRVSACVLAGMALLLASSPSFSLGFGEPDSRAILGDTLRLTVPVRLEPGEEINDECIAADVYFGDEKLPSKAVVAELLPGSAFLRSVKVRTTALINEPIVTIYVAAGCHARITRKFVALADPPAMPATTVSAQSPSSIAAPRATAAPVQAPGAGMSATRLPAESAQRQAAPAASRVGSPAKAPALARAEAVTAPPADKAAAEPHHPFHRAPKGMPKAAPKSPRAVAPPQQGTPRLELDPAEADALAVPSLRFSASLGQVPVADQPDEAHRAQRDAAAAMWRALNASPEQVAKDQERLQELTQRLAQLKQEGEADRSAASAMRTQLAAASSQSGFSKWWVVLIGLMLLGFGLAFHFWRELRQQRREGSAWWQGGDAQDSDSDAGPLSGSDDEDERSDPDHTTTEFVHVPSQATAAPSPLKEVPPAPLATNDTVVMRAMATQALHGVEPTPLPRIVPDKPLQMPSTRPQPESLREVSVEELIDLEQQAEFFIVLGQDDAAIDLLESHVQGTTGGSPLPFLKLLEIYRRLNRPQAYERVQMAFNERFNAHAPAWDADMQQGHDLADYPGIVERLQSLWSRPDMAMEVLEKSLTRPESGDETFELPAYRELLLLYAVARDLSEREMADRSKVDLLLPITDLDEHKHITGDEARVIQPLMATRPIKAQPDLSPSIKVDVSLDDLDEPHKP